MAWLRVFWLGVPVGLAADRFQDDGGGEPSIKLVLESFDETDQLCVM